MRFFPMTVLHALILCALAYLAVTAPGLLTEGFTSDDWQQLQGAPDLWVGVGRWTTHFLSSTVFAGHYVLPLQTALAFACFAWISYLLAHYAVAEKLKPAAMALIFVVGVNHIYMSDVLVFASHVFGYPLALALSLSSFHLLRIMDASWSPLRKAAIFIAAAQLLALSLGLYQSFAVFGLLIPILVLMKTEIRAIAPALRYFLMCIGASVVALMIYFLELNLYASVTGLSFLGLDTQSLTLMSNGPTWWESLVHKVRYLPGTLNKLHSLTSLRVPAELMWFNRSFLAIILLMASAVAGFALLSEQKAKPFIMRMLDGGRVLFSVGAALFIAPLLIYFTFAPYLPPRATGYLGFTYAAVFLAALALLTDLANEEARARLIKYAGLTFLCSVGVVYLLVASMVWQDRKRIGDRDLELARAIFTRVSSLPGYDGSAFLIYGGVEYDKRIMWGSSLSRTVFRKYKVSEPNEVRMQIFKEMYNLPWTADVVPESPRPCPAFPAYASVFMHEGTAYVCLDASS